MIKNYLKIACRNLVKNIGYSFINIGGLTVGIACFLLIFIFVLDELRYDRHFTDADNIYRINTDINFGGTEQKTAESSAPLGSILKSEYPEVTQFTRINVNQWRKFIKKEKEFVIEYRIAHVDSTFFDMFSLSLAEGNRKIILTEPNTVALSKSMALKYFGATAVVGETLEIGFKNPVSYKITGVFDDMPSNSHFQFDFLFPMENLENTRFDDLQKQNFHTYIKLRKGTDIKAFNDKLIDIANKYVLSQPNQQNTEVNRLKYSVIPLLDIHLRSNREYELGVNGNIQYVYILSIVAFFLLIVACINFINLSTARSASRAKEIGIRKVLGTQRHNLVYQFITESTLFSYMSLGFAILLMPLLLPYFNEITAKNFGVSSLLSLRNLLFLFLLPAAVGILAGAYPAFFMAAFKPIEIIKGKTNTGFKRNHFRNLLVTFQFTTAIVLIISTTVIFRQLNYIQNKNLGYSKDQVLIVSGTSALRDHAGIFKNEISKMAGVKNASFSGYLPVENSSRNESKFSKEAGIGIRNSFTMQDWAIDHQYIPTLGMEMSKGRNFSTAFLADSSAVIINEEAAKILGFAEPIGKNIYCQSNLEIRQATRLNIVGVVKNFHFTSLHDNIDPLCFRLGESNWETAFKIDNQNLQDLIDAIEKKWKQLAPDMPFNYHFLDDSFNEMFQSERRIGNAILLFSVLTIIIACLGVLGLITYIAERRSKEIGVRKVLGATEWNIVALLSRDFALLILISFLTACPIAYFSMKQWLNNFTYQGPFTAWPFIIAGTGALVITLFTVSYQAIKAAIANPVKSLRTE